EMRLGPAKGKDTATTLGPWLVTKDEIEPWRRPMGYDLEMVVSVNGREYGRDRWSNAFWSLGEIIAYASRGTKVSAGDVPDPAAPLTETGAALPLAPLSVTLGARTASAPEGEAPW